MENIVGLKLELYFENAEKDLRDEAVVTRQRQEEIEKMGKDLEALKSQL